MLWTNLVEDHSSYISTKFDLNRATWIKEGVVQRKWPKIASMIHRISKNEGITMIEQTCRKPIQGTYIQNLKAIWGMISEKKSFQGKLTDDGQRLNEYMISSADQRSQWSWKARLTLIKVEHVYVYVAVFIGVKRWCRFSFLFISWLADQGEVCLKNHSGWCHHLSCDAACRAF